MIKTKIYTKPKNTGASGGSTTKVTRLQGIATEAEYASKAGRASEADKAKEAGSAQYAEQAGHAGTAGYATKAGEVDLSAEALDHFARKDQDETFKGKVGFEQDVNFEAAALFADVVTMLKELKAQGGIETDYVRSANYDEDTQQGFGLSRTKNGGYRLSLSELEVWCKAIFHELEIRKLSYAGGNVYLSGAGSKIVHVEEQYSASGVTTGWKCYLLADDGSTATQNLWRVKDQARCQSFNILEGKHEGASNKSYWRLVTEVSTQPVTIKTADGTALYGGRLFDWVTLSATDCMVGSDTPAAGDTIVLDGASEDATRQGVLMLESTGNGTPRIVGLRGVNSYSHEGKEVFVLSPDGSRFYNKTFEWVSSTGDAMHMVNYRGEWQKGVSYGHYDQVNHNNALWTCVNPNGCNSEPKDGTSDWQKVLSGEKGEQGAQGPKGETGVQGPQGEKGDDAVVYTLEASPSYIRLSSDGSIDYANGYIDKGDEYGSDKYLVVRGYKVAKGVRDNRFSTEESPVTLRLTINDGSAYSEYTPSDHDSVSIDFEPKYEDSYYSMLQEISYSGLNSVRVELCEGSEYNPNKILATCDIPIIRNGKDGQKGDQGEKGEQGIKGDKGEDGLDGADGEDAISILVEDAPLVFDTDDSGTVPASVKKTAKVKVMKGKTNVTDDCTELSSRNDLSSNCMCNVEKDEDNGCISVSVQGNWISKNDVIVEGVNQGQVSATSGYAVAQFVYAGVVYFAQVPFSVNVAKFTGVVAFNNKQYESKFTEISNKFNKDLAVAESRITQAAREISISVSEKSIGRRNLLVGSAFNRQEGFGLNRDSNIRGYGILMNDGVDGMNCIKVASYYDTNRHQYCGAFWGGSYTKNIRIKHGTQYTFSCWVKVDEADMIVYLEVIYNRAEIGQDRDGRPTGAYAFAIKEPNKWQLVKWSFTTDDTHNWIEANVSTCSGVAYKTFVARFCKPMLEEGDYNGWTLSQEDYDYVGGNLLEDTMALTRSSDNSNLQFASGLIMFSKYEGCYGILYNKNNSAESQYTEALQYKFPTTATLSGQARIVKNQDYVFSFVAKGSGNINVYLYGDSVHANVFTETCEGNVYPVGWADGYAQLALTSTFKRYWVHWRIGDYTGEGAEVIPDKVLIRVPGDTEAWVTKPKLEEGAQLTDYTERKTDLIDRATAKAAGLEITSRGVTLYGEKIKVENTLSTGQTTTAALFTDGAINAALILAQMLTSKGLNGQMVRIADGLINIYGKAGTANIRFGLNSSGQAVLSYYDDNGNFLYDLGPAGVASLSKTDAKITSAQYIKAEDAGLTTPLGENVDLPWVDTTKSWYTATKDNNYILFVKGATGKTTTLYRYSAPRVNGKIVADSANGLGTYNLASAADGRTFTSRTMVKNGALTNLADGVFLTADAKAYDNTKLVPSIKKGQSVTRPSFYVQIASFKAKFTTRGLLGKIYSIQTEITFGNLDVGIMSNNNY